ncbi:zinc finger protein 208-like isoform X1 [Cydia strobilella]|uniref:zinc finger protein 208-like isoform X1 n=1 Tax=Cydia strobilella TaxID=1100964 RepID=UPI0030064305
MDVENLKSWVSQPDVCRCCLSASGTWDLTASYVTEAGIKEVFSNILQECYGISLSYLSEWGPSRLVCALCVGHLRHATSFKNQVQEADRYFTEYLSKRDCIEMIKTEPDADYSADDFAEKMEIPRSDTSPLRKDVKTTLKQNKSANRKRHKHSRAKEKTRKDSDCDSDTPLTLLSKRSQDIDRNNIDVNIDDNMEHIDLQCEEIDDKTDNPIAESSSWKSPRVTPESYIENRHLRSNITLILKNSTILPFKHINKYKYTCLYCDSSYLFFKQLKIHINDKHNNVTEKDISRRLKTPKNLIKAEVSEIRCKLCDITLKSIDILTEHLVKNHNKIYYNTSKFKPSHGILGFDLTSEKFRCHICKREFRFFKNLSIHMNEHSANFVCHYCGKKFLSDHRLHAHVKMHKENDLKCKVCEKQFRSSSARAYHVRKIHSKTAYKCPECDEVFLQYQKRMQHLVEAHNLKKPEYKCDICHKNYASSGGLSAHVQYAHLKNREYPCQICGKNFGYKWTLKKHLVVHSGAKNFECKFCSKRFAEPYTLKVHLRIHLNEKPYSCAICKAAFIQKCSLKNHTRVHHPDLEIDFKKI